VVYQGFRYEGLTVNFLELVYSAGGSVVNEDATEVTADSQEVRDVLTFMANGIKDGAAPKAVTTYKEEESRRAFESGNATFRRNWPYAYALGKESKIGKEFAITTLPGYAGNEGAGVLGGYNLAISAYSKNPEGALAFMNFATSPDQQVIQVTDASLPAVLTDVYSDPKVKKALPFAADLLKAVEQALPRPVSPVYPQISEAISTLPRRCTRTSRRPSRRSSPMEAATARLKSRPAKRGGYGRSERRLAAAMLAPSLIVIAAVAAYPIGYAFWLSLTEYSLRVPGKWRFVGFDNYTEALSSPEFWDAFTTTFIFSGISVAIELVIGIGMALCMHEAFKGRGLLRTVVPTGTASESRRAPRAVEAPGPERRWLKPVLLWTAVVLIVIFCLFPFYWLINVSLKTGPDLSGRTCCRPTRHSTTTGRSSRTPTSRRRSETASASRPSPRCSRSCSARSRPTRWPGCASRASSCCSP
jgi:ABC-type glycerol-3-phosphate transport system permease component